MNHLAHALLAGADDDLRLGAFLGDHVKGRDALRQWPERVAQGIALHRRIDHWSDHHPAVRDLRGLAPAPWRRYSGIAFDVLFDAVLTRRWARYGDRPLARFGDELDALLVARRAALPNRLRRFSEWARTRRLWLRLDQRPMLEEIFRLLALRHGRPSPLAHGVDLLDRMGPQIETAFERLFPDLQDAARNYLDASRKGAGSGPREASAPLGSSVSEPG